MPSFRLTAFSGEIPRLIPRLLPDTAAQMAFDTRLENGDLTPVRMSRAAFSSASLPVVAPASIYRHLGAWLFWPSFVKATPGPVAQDRLYYMGDGAPKMRVGSTVYTLALTPPAVALTATLGGGGSGDIVVRVYAYTNVSQFGEETEPSPVSNEVNWRPGNTVTLSGFSTSMGDRTATTQRIYRSQTSLSGVTNFFLIAERVAGTNNFIDNVAPDDIQEALPSLDWNPPPSTLKGLIALPNGMMAAYTGKDLYFAEPFIPHAWPEKYVLTTEYDIMGLGAFGNSIVVVTKGNPYIVTGTAPESMVMEKLELNLPCVNEAAVIDLGYAVAYPSYDGLVVVSSGGARIATEQLFTRTQWTQLNPVTFAAGQYDGRYFATYSYTDSAGMRFDGTLILDLTGEQPFVIRTDDLGLAFFHDPTTGELFFLDSAQNIREWNPLGRPNKSQNWRSKEIILPKPSKMSAIFVEAEPLLTDAEIADIQARAAIVLAANQAVFDSSQSLNSEMNGAELNGIELHGDSLAEIPTVADNFVAVNVYAEGRLIASVSTINRMARIPAGFLARKWEIEVTANIPVTQVALAGTAAELMQVP